MNAYCIGLLLGALGTGHVKLVTQCHHGRQRNRKNSFVLETLSKHFETNCQFHNPLCLDVNVSPYVENAGISETTEETPIVTEEPISMSTEKSATFSISVDSGKSPLFEPTARKVPTGNDGQNSRSVFLQV